MSETPLTLWDEAAEKGATAGFTGAGKEGRFNLALHAGGDPGLAHSNRRELCRRLHIPFAAYTCAEQVHGTHITIVTGAERGRGRLSQEDAIPASDALLTGERGIFLNIFVADCVPIILYDSRSGAGGLCHSGWRGTAGLIASKAIEAMKENFLSRPEEIKALIGPSIGGCCYTVGNNVQEAFRKNFTYAESPFAERDDRLYLDLKKANRSQLMNSGLKPENITISPLCTYCGEKPLFSYRKSGDAAGRFSAFLYLGD